MFGLEKNCPQMTVISPFALSLHLSSRMNAYAVVYTLRPVATTENEPDVFNDATYTQLRGFESSSTTQLPSHTQPVYRCLKR